VATVALPGRVSGIARTLIRLSDAQEAARRDPAEQ